MSERLRKIADRQRLTSRAAYFFATSAGGRGEVARFSEALQKLGPVVVIGGLLRDLYLSGTREFRSDVDFVVDPASLREFEHFVNGFGAQPNQFGGYGIRLRHWRVDVWPLERTWASVSGHVAVNDFEDLIKSTFFDWDAVLYHLTERRVITTKTYFQRLRSKVIEINLEPNPNPLGNAVRALRYAYRWDAALGERLATHVAREIENHGWDCLVEAERRSFAAPMLASLDGEQVAGALGRVCMGEPVWLNLRPSQQVLPLEQVAV